TQERDASLDDHHKDNLIFVDEVDADCVDKDGVASHYECEACGSWFKKPFGKPYTKIDPDSCIIEAGHVESVSYYGDGYHHWTTCVRCATQDPPIIYIIPTSYAPCVDEDGNQYCDVCVSLIPCQHNWGEWNVYEYCDSEGQMTRECLICHDSESTVIPAIGHTDSAWLSDGTNHYKECTVCHKITVEKTAHSGGTATCSERKECTVCHHKYGEFNTSNHTGTAEWTQTPTQHVKTYTCCGAVAIEKAAHTFADGICTLCAYQCHHHSEYIEGKAATCTIDGYRECYHCTYCNLYFSDSMCTVKIDYASWNTGAGKLIAEHKYGNLIEKQSAVHTVTELKAGMHAHYRCSVCQGYFDENKNPTTENALKIAKPEHSYGSWIKDNSKHWKVCDCGLKAEEHTHNYSDASDMLCNDCGWDRTAPHTCGNGVAQNGQNATCTVNGWQAYYKCSCGKIFTDSACTNEITSLEEWKNGAGKIAASHTYGELIAKVNATCSAMGMNAHYQCSVCHTLFDENRSVKTENELMLPIDAAAHVFGDLVSNGNGTHSKVCTLNGNHKETASCSGGKATCTEKAICSTCNGAYGELLAHSYQTAWRSDADGHWNECLCGDKANIAPHTDSDSDGKCDICTHTVTADTPPIDDPSQNTDGLGTGAIIAIILVTVIVCSAAATAVILIIRKKKTSKNS
ncbi:MAG: hypothetical protein IKC63_03275, partial [Clostridia bacterium]|nr:hypothetical protein [Clostridia bacterium]